MPPPANAADFKKERLPWEVFTVVMTEKFDGTYLLIHAHYSFKLTAEFHRVHAESRGVF